MARYKDPVCRLCRREGERLFLKGNRCLSDKCAVAKRRLPPGGGKSRRVSKLSDYGIQLREKQRVKRYYGLLEKQYKLTFETAVNKKGKTGDIFISLLELRLDNVVYRMNLASSRAQARQLINHGHIRVNGKKVDIPSYRCREGDEIEVKEKSKKMRTVLEALKNVSRGGVPNWMEIDVDNAKGKIINIPQRQDIVLPFLAEDQIQLVVEFYSK